MPEKTPAIGSFTKPQGPISEGQAAISQFMQDKEREKRIKELQKEESAPVGAPQESQVEDEAMDLEQEIEKLKKSPELSYEERIRKHGIDLRTANLIVDSLLFKGEFRYTYPVTKKYTVTFKTRKFEDQEKTLGHLETVNPQFPASVGNLISKNNLANSLVKFGDTDFTKMTFEARIDWLNSIPETLARLLAKKLSKFDEMILDIMDEGVIENF